MKARSKENNKRFKNVALIALIFSIITSSASAFEVMVSLNCYSKERVTDAINRVSELKADGAWFLYGNSNFSDSEWGTILNKLPGKQYTEDIEENNNAYSKYHFVMGRRPDGAFYYTETGGTPGGTLLTDVQINNKYIQTGYNPVMPLTRAYVGDWKTETDRCLNNSKIDGIVCESVKEAIIEATPGVHNGIPQLMDACQSHGKKLFFLVHAAPDGWWDADQHTMLSKLYGWNPSYFASDNVTIVYQYYDNSSIPANTTYDWLGSSQSVKSAMFIAMNHAAYSGVGSGSPIGQTIWLESQGSGLYVSADLAIGPDRPLAARRSAVGAWEKFKVVDAGGGLIALQATVNNKYVCADYPVTPRPLEADRSSIGAWEKFTWISNVDGTISLKAAANNKYVVAEGGPNWLLNANRSVIGSWEKFIWGNAN